MTKASPPPLEQAPEHIQLAVDLIQVLEDANIEVNTAIKALEIALADFIERQKQ